LRLADAESVECERDCGNGRNRISQKRQRVAKLDGPSLNRRAILGADGVERVLEPADKRVQNSDGDRRGGEREDDGQND